MLGGRLVIAVIVLFAEVVIIYDWQKEISKRIREQQQHKTFKNLARSPVFRSERECLLRAKL
jgi:hypothetical protein